MKKVIVLSLGLFALTACNNQNKNTTENATMENQSEVPAIGGEKDKHGCISATGESWSELRQECLRIFDKGIRLNPTEVTEGEAVISAFAVFNDDKSKVEIFLPEEGKDNPIINQSESGVYQNEVYKYDANEAALYINGEKKFEAEKN